MHLANVTIFAESVGKSFLTKVTNSVVFVVVACVVAVARVVVVIVALVVVVVMNYCS